MPSILLSFASLCRDNYYTVIGHYDLGIVTTSDATSELTTLFKLAAAITLVIKSLLNYITITPIKFHLFRQ